jgi:hypothetical protein
MGGAAHIHIIRTNTCTNHITGMAQLTTPAIFTNLKFFVFLHASSKFLAAITLAKFYSTIQLMLHYKVFLLYRQGYSEVANNHHFYYFCTGRESW